MAAQYTSDYAQHPDTTVYFSETNLDPGPLAFVILVVFAPFLCLKRFCFSGAFGFFLSFPGFVCDVSLNLR